MLNSGFMIAALQKSGYKRTLLPRLYRLTYRPDCGNRLLSIEMKIHTHNTGKHHSRTANAGMTVNAYGPVSANEPDTLVAKPAKRPVPGRNTEIRYRKTAPLDCGFSTRLRKRNGRTRKRNEHPYTLGCQKRDILTQTVFCAAPSRKIAPCQFPGDNP